MVQVGHVCDKDEPPLAEDLNETHSLEERDHGGTDMVRCCARFNNWIENNALLDLSDSGPRFTWGPYSRNICECARLDRALRDMESRARFYEGNVKRLLWNQSHHTPLFIYMVGFSLNLGDPKPFGFQAVWMIHQDFKRFLIQSWKDNAPLTTTLGDPAGELSNWNKDVFGNFQSQPLLIHARVSLRVVLSFKRASCKKRTFFRMYRWVHDHPLVEVALHPISMVDQAKTVVDYWSGGRGWRRENLTDMLPKESLKMIATIEVYPNSVQRKKFGGTLSKRDKESTTQDLVSNNGSLATFSMQ
ncbi:LOW QUALITY PROTEIN: hypothetical protein Cgig2_000517 [Carnegiea gigantea]|uniref:Uncharacterized protein n=1 Tax=Carnegiea gigantea TaxID=171969 RepID=A0A9Q1GQ97_9CARY|nr:LOW QUALITY PROTEIN: hypothetical protein Cgig2_000517 [Carnegiea gigantea]